MKKKIAKLKGMDEMKGTHTFVRLVTRFGNIINIRFPDAASGNHPIAKFTNGNDPRLEFLTQLARMC